MSFAPMNNLRLRGIPQSSFGQLLANVAGHAPRPMSLVPVSPGLGLGDNLLAAVQSPPQARSASPASGGIAAAPTMGDEAAPPPQPRPAFSRGQIIAGIVADALAGAAGREGQFANMLQQQRQRDDTRDYEDVKWRRDRAAKREDELRPRVEEVGGSIGMLDPSEQSFQPFYEKPQVFESYARAQGFEPGSPEYAQAVQDYRLGSWSDPAMENRYGLEGVRYGHRDSLQDQRLRSGERNTDVRVGVSRENNIRSTSTSAANNRRSTATSSANNVRSTGQSNTNSVRSNDTRLQTAPRRKGIGNAAGPVAVGPNGERLVVRNGKWVDEKTGRPVQ